MTAKPLQRRRQAWHGQYIENQREHQNLPLHSPTQCSVSRGLRQMHRARRHACSVRVRFAYLLCACVRIRACMYVPRQTYIHPYIYIYIHILPVIFLFLIKDVLSPTAIPQVSSRHRCQQSINRHVVTHSTLIVRSTAFVSVCFVILCSFLLRFECCRCTRTPGQPYFQKLL